MIYINRKGNGYTETVSEYTSRKEARKDLAEYRQSEPDAEYWLSSRACKEWRESNKAK